MQLTQFIEQLNNAPDTIQFQDTIATIDSYYEFTPTGFQNGEIFNVAGQNSGSCKIFSFAQQQGFNELQTLACFGDFYRIEVLQHPEATDHQNIRNFMKFGWEKIQFESTALKARTIEQA